MNKILIVDDNKIQVKTLKGVLLKEGYDVITAYDGEVGLIKAKELKPDLIFLDIKMPGMDGYEMCEKLKSDKETKDIKIVMLTGKDMGDDFDEAMKKDADWYIVKPYSFEHVFKVMEKLNIK